MAAAVVSARVHAKCISTLAVKIKLMIFCAGTIWKPTAPEHEREAQSAAMFDAMFDSITAVMPMGSPVAVT